MTTHCPVFPSEISARVAMPFPPARESRTNGRVAVPHLEQPKVQPRKRFFRCGRLVLAGALVYGAAAYLRYTFTGAISEHAFINAEMTTFKAPINGVVRMEPLRAGSPISPGAKLFRIENPRFGNQEAMAQRNWIKELAERLRAESEEAAVRFGHQQQVYELQKRLYQDQLISRLSFIEEESKVDLSRVALTSKRTQAQDAEQRYREIERQLELQKEAVVTTPFAGLAWNVFAKDGLQVAAHETLLQVIDPRNIWVDAFFHERQARKFRRGSIVAVRTIDGKQHWRGVVESIRGNGPLLSDERAAAVAAGEQARRRIAVRIKLQDDIAFGASDFYGVGRSVIVNLQP